MSDDSVEAVLDTGDVDVVDVLDEVDEIELAMAILLSLVIGASGPTIKGDISSVRTLLVGARRQAADRT